MTDTATLTQPFVLGDTVTYRYGGAEHTGTVHGTYRYERNGVDGTDNNTSPDSVWVTGIGYTTTLGEVRRNVGGYDSSLSSRYVLDTPDHDDETGVWASVEHDSVRHESALSESAAQITALEATVSDLRSQVEEARRVITQIGEGLAAHADDSEWCGTYESHVRDLYRSLPGAYGFDDAFKDAAVRNRQFTIRWTMDGTATVEARSEEAARESFREGAYYLGSFYSSHDNVEISEVEED